jgi:hypothetical protein
MTFGTTFLVHNLINYSLEELNLAALENMKDFDAAIDEAMESVLNSNSSDPSASEYCASSSDTDSSDTNSSAANCDSSNSSTLMASTQTIIISLRSVGVQTEDSGSSDGASRKRKSLDDDYMMKLGNSVSNARCDTHSQFDPRVGIMANTQNGLVKMILQYQQKWTATNHVSLNYLCLLGQAYDKLNAVMGDAKLKKLKVEGMPAHSTMKIHRQNFKLCAKYPKFLKVNEGY